MQNTVDMEPCVSVLMSVYNGERYLEEAIESILNQTFRDFEFIIINDGSADGTAGILAHYQRVDDRVRVYDQENRGLVASLNRGGQLARGEYIARMDADDVSLPERLRKQVDYMETHPEVGVMGTQMKQIDEKGRLLSAFDAPLAHEAILWKMLFECAIAHPTVLMRRHLLIEAGGYDPSYAHIEDTELWSRLIWVTRFANHRESLFLRRWHKESVCNLHAAEQFQVGMSIRRSLFERILAREVRQEVVEWLSSSWYAETILTDSQIKEVIALLLELYHALVKTKSVCPADAQGILDDLLNRILVVNSRSSYIIERERSYWRKRIPMPVRRIGKRLLDLTSPRGR